MVDLVLKRASDRWLAPLAIALGILFALLIVTQDLLLVTLIVGIVVIGILLTLYPLTILPLLIILSPLRTLVATEATIRLPLDIGQILLVAYGGLWVVYRILRRESFILYRWSSLYIPLVAFLVATAVSFANVISVSLWLTEWLKWVIVLLLIPLVMRLLEHLRWQWLLFALLMAVVANAVIGLYIFFGGSGADHLLINGRFFRAFGTFGQPNPFGGFMGLFIPIAATMSLAYLWRVAMSVYRSRTVNWKDMIQLAFYGSVSVVLLAGLVASWSRGAWLSFIASMAFVAFALPRKLWQSVALSAGVGVLVLGLWFGGLLPQSIVARIASSTEQLFSFSDVRGVDITSANYAIVERLAHWQAALNMVTDKPWLGIGFGNYEVAYEQYRLMNWDEPLGHAHNYYLNILAEAGLLGLITYLAFWGYVLWLTWRLRQHPDLDVRLFAVGLCGTWIYLAFHSLLDNLYVNNLFLHLGMLLGMLSHLSKQITQSLQWD